MFLQAFKPHSSSQNNGSQASQMKETRHHLAPSTRLTSAAAPINALPTIVTRAPTL